MPKAEDCGTPADDQCTGAIAPCGATATWSKRFGDVFDYQEASALALDDAADVLIAGAFAGSADFGGGALASAGSSDLFLAKYAPSGSHLWSKHFAGNLGGALIATDGLGDVLCAASVTGLVDFGGGALPGQDQTYEAVLAKLDAQGGYLWAKRWGVPNKQVSAAGLKAMPNGDIAVMVQYWGTIDFGCGPTSPPSSYPNGVAVAKLRADGTCAWSKSFGGAPNVENMGVDAAGDVYVAGTFLGQVDLGGGIVGGTTNSPTYIFLSKMGPDGSHLFSKTWLVGYPGACSASGLAVDAAGNVVLTGLFGPGGGNPPPVSFNLGGSTLNGAAYQNTYLVKLDPNGTALWSKTFGAGRGFGVALDPSGQVVATGEGGGTLDFGGGPMAVSGIYVARFSAGGTPLGARAYSGGSTPHVAVDGLGNVILAGGFGGTLDLATSQLVSAGGRDGYVADIGP